MGLIFWIFLIACVEVNAQQTNPFDLKRSDSIDIEEPVVEEQEDPLQEIKIDADNPFTVSHIPIRKNQYEQIEKLTINKHQAEESISIVHLPLWIVIISLCLLAFMILRQKSHVYNLLRNMLNQNLMRQKAYDERGGLSMVYAVGYLIFLLNVALFLYMINGKLFEAQTTGFLYILLAVSLFFIGKHIVLSIVSALYEFDKEAKVYSFTIATIYNILALVFLSINTIILFGPDSWIRFLAILTFIVFVIFLFSRYYKGLYVARKYLSQYFFHFLLYFCAFEFSPWLIVYGLVRDFI